MITKKEKKLKRELMLKLMNENEDWESDENIRKEVRSLADGISDQISHKSKPVTKLKRHIIHLVKRGLSNNEISETVCCTPQYVTVTAGELRNGYYNGYLEHVYINELMALSLYRKGLDVKQISDKMELKEEIVKEVIEFN